MSQQNNSNTEPAVIEEPKNGTSQQSNSEPSQQVNKDTFISPADFRMNDFIDKDKKEDSDKSGEGKDSPASPKKEETIVPPKNNNDNKAVPPSAQPSAVVADSSQANQEPSPDDIKEFIKALKEDVPKAWNKFYKKFDLPAFELVQQVLRGTEFDDSSLRQRIKLYQKELSKNIEKEFNLDPGTFRYDADEAIDPDSPSGVFLSRLRQYEDELKNDVKNKLEIARQQQEKYKQLQEEDKKWFRETFYKDQPERVDEILDELSKIPQKILAGELPAHKHPFSLRTMLLGVFFDDLVEKIKKETEENIKAAYESQGMFLTNKPAPDDLKKISKGISDEDNRYKKKVHSPLDNLIIDFLNK